MINATHRDQCAKLLGEHGSELSSLRLSIEQKEALHNSHNDGVMTEHLNWRESVNAEHASQLATLNLQIETMKETHKASHGEKDA
jgi:hypothetical protein